MPNTGIVAKCPICYISSFGDVAKYPLRARKTINAPAQRHALLVLRLMKTMKMMLGVFLIGGLLNLRSWRNSHDSMPVLVARGHKG